jgi:hypothetical protein
MHLALAKKMPFQTYAPTINACEIGHKKVNESVKNRAEQDALLSFMEKKTPHFKENSHFSVDDFPAYIQIIGPWHRHVNRAGSCFL